MRKAFYAGACHLFGCLAACREADIHDDEVPRCVYATVMQAISNELYQFNGLIDLEAREVEGQA
jgi:hypothetical protein